MNWKKKNKASESKKTCQDTTMNMFFTHDFVVCWEEIQKTDYCDMLNHCYSIMWRNRFGGQELHSYKFHCTDNCVTKHGTNSMQKDVQ